MKAFALGALITFTTIITAWFVVMANAAPGNW